MIYFWKSVVFGAFIKLSKNWKLENQAPADDTTATVPHKPTQTRTMESVKIVWVTFHGSNFRPDVHTIAAAESIKVSES